MTIGERVKKARMYARLSQAELGKRVGVTQQALGRLENNQADTTRALALIAVECKVSPRWLATGQGDMLDGSQPTEAVALSSRELALIANCRASAEDDRAKLERMALAVAQKPAEYATSR